MDDNSFSEADACRLRELVYQSIAHGLNNQSIRMTVDPGDFPESFQVRRSCFVTLRRDQALRGCVGRLQPRDILPDDVAYHAHSAAFEDPRFESLKPEEFPGLEIAISILSPTEPLETDSENDLLRIIRPGIDGLTLRDGRHFATLLPSVWSHCRSPQEFVASLKVKAGLAPDYWSDELAFQRYTAESY